SLGYPLEQEAHFRHLSPRGKHFFYFFVCLFLN
ncbi:MAG: hypothetical protein ACI9LM_004753, partial [Alteromonadaceae bacterium]